MFDLFHRRRANHLERALAAIAAATTDYEVIAQLRASARRITGADRSAVLRREGDEIVALTEDATNRLWGGLRIPLARSVSATALRSGQPVLIHDLLDDARVPHSRYDPKEVRGAALYPIADLLVLGIYWRAPCTPSAAVRSSAQRLAGGAAEAIRRLRGETPPVQSREPMHVASASLPSGGAHK